MVDRANDNSLTPNLQWHRMLAYALLFASYSKYRCGRNGEIKPFANGGTGKRQFPDSTPAMAPYVDLRPTIHLVF